MSHYHRNMLPKDRRMPSNKVILPSSSTLPTISYDYPPIPLTATTTTTTATTPSFRADAIHPTNTVSTDAHPSVPVNSAQLQSFSPQTLSLPKHRLSDIGYAGPAPLRSQNTQQHQPGAGRGRGGPLFCSAMQYAHARKEEAREDFKERRREELIHQGDFDRVKRRKKNDRSMSDNQKYRRRLKMNQDSAAAARYAQEVYVQTLEELIAATEVETSSLAVEWASLQAEKHRLVSQLGQLQTGVVVKPATISDPQRTLRESSKSHENSIHPRMTNSSLSTSLGVQSDPEDSTAFIQKLFEAVDGLDAVNMMARGDAERATAELSAFSPARAV